MVRFLHIFPRQHIKTAALIAAVLAMFVPAVAYAAEEQPLPAEQITLSPTSKQHVLNAGESVTDSFKVINTGSEAFTFKVYGEPYSVADRTYVPNYSTNAPRADAHNWVTLETTKATIEPGETKVINYTIAVPETGGLGGHYGVLFAETQPVESENNQEVLRKKRVGMILRVTVDGDTRLSGDVVASKLSPVQFRAPLRSTLEIKNDGNTDFEAQTSIVVKSLFGDVKYRYDRTNVIYPETTRVIDQNWDGVSWFGLYKVDVTATYLDKNFQQSRYVLVTPIWLVLLVVMVAIAGAYAFYMRKE